MTGEEIIKALKCCLNNDDCYNCPYVVNGGTCGRKKDKDVLDLINRQKAEIYKLQEIIVMGKFTSHTAVRATQSWHRQHRENIKRLKEEIERLEEENKKEKLYNLRMTAHSIKTEAVKDFAKKIDKIITEIYNKHIFGNNDLTDEEKDAVINFSADVTNGLEKLKEELAGDPYAET